MFKHLLFDLDDTLYPPDAPLHQALHRRIILYAAEYLGLAEEEAARLWRGKMKEYPSTLEWLQKEYRFDRAADFMERTHPPCEVDEVPADPRLRPFLQGLGLPMTILTNGPRAHALRVLEKLNAADLFLDIWDIERMGWRGKPRPEAYLGCIEGTPFTVEDTLYLEDSPRYLRGWLDLGGRGALVSPDASRAIPGVPQAASVYGIGPFLE